MRTTARPGRASILSSLFLLVLTTLILAASAELLVRVGRLQSDTFTQPDPKVGWVHIPDRRGLYTSPEVRNEFVTNDLGLMGPRRPLAKPPGTRRLLLIGDSFTESLQVEWPASWPAVVEQSLGENWEVWNAGIAGYGTSNALLYLREYGLSYQPDAVFLLVFTGNDISDNSRQLGMRIGSWAPQPYFDLVGDSLAFRPLVLAGEANGTLSSVKRWLRNHSRAYLFLRERLQRIRAVSQQEQASADRVPLTWHVYKKSGMEGNDLAQWNAAWQLTEQLLIEMHRSCLEAGVPLFVASIPTGWRVDPLLREKILDRYPSLADTAQWDFALPDRRLAGIMDSSGVPYLDLTHTLLSAVDPASPLYSDHLTPRGHRVVGDAVSAFLKPALVDESPATGPEGERFPQRELD